VRRTFNKIALHQTERIGDAAKLADPVVVDAQ
jgi:hypothetical protein